MAEELAAPPVAEQAAAVQGKRADVVPSSSARLATMWAFVVTDLIAVALLIASAHAVSTYFAVGPRAYELLVPMIGLLGAGFVLSGLYSAIDMHPVQELRLVSIVAALVVGAYAFGVWFVGAAGEKVLLGLWTTGFMAVLIISFCRVFSRILLAQASWWGVPVVVLTNGQVGRKVVRVLKRWPEIGLKPVALLQDDAEQHSVEGVPVVGGVDQAAELVASHTQAYAIIAMETHQQPLNDLIRRCSKLYKKVVVLPSIPGISMLWTPSHFYDGLIGYGVQDGDRHRTGRAVKRAVDIVGALVLLVLLAPLLLTIAVLIKMDSHGPVFFRQTRLGKGGRCFEVFKFRSMHVDADQKLEELLKQDPSVRAEYMKFRKLRNDPRVTTIGRVIRQYSLDELPQLFNVLRGNMSLTGPRAYTPNELPAMESLERIILQNRPGISGLWQVSGRNALSFAERLEIDVHYVQNWTPWLDMYILARTVPVVLKGEGAC